MSCQATGWYVFWRIVYKLQSYSNKIEQRDKKWIINFKLATSLWIHIYIYILLLYLLNQIIMFCRHCNSNHENERNVQFFLKRKTIPIRQVFTYYFRIKSHKQNETQLAYRFWLLIKFRFQFIWKQFFFL